MFGMTDVHPDDLHEPDLDGLTRDALRELGGPPAALVDVLDDWLLREHGVLSGSHCVGSFLDLLAAEGYRVTPIDPGPTFEELLPASPD